MPWSSPCKCPAHIAYGRAIGIKTLWMIVKAGYRISHQCMDIQFQRKPYSFVHNKSTGTLICFLKKKSNGVLLLYPNQKCIPNDRLHFYRRMIV